jgi:hypothetical protein
LILSAALRTRAASFCAAATTGRNILDIGHSINLNTTCDGSRLHVHGARDSGRRRVGSEGRRQRVAEEGNVIDLVFDMHVN